MIVHGKLPAQSHMKRDRTPSAGIRNLSESFPDQAPAFVQLMPNRLAEEPVVVGRMAVRQIEGDIADIPINRGVSPRAGCDQNETTVHVAGSQAVSFRSGGYLQVEAGPDFHFLIAALPELPFVGEEQVGRTMGVAESSGAVGISNLVSKSDAQLAAGIEVRNKVRGHNEVRGNIDSLVSGSPD